MEISFGILSKDLSGRFIFEVDDMISANVSIDLVDLLLNNFSM
jgi:hypothetical protein